MLASRAAVLCCLVAVCCALTVSAAASAPWQDVAVLDCAGQARLFPSHPVLAMAVNASVLTNTFNQLSSAFVSRMSCRCPSIGNSFLPDLGTVLASIESKSDQGASTRSTCGLKFSFDQVGQYFTNYQLPNTCTSALYNAGQACTLSMPVSGFSVNMQLAIQRCPNQPAGSMPSISLSCSGQLCKDLLLPCATDADCKGSTCSLLSSGTAASIQTSVATFLDTVQIMPAGEQDSCSATSKDFTAANVGTKVFSGLMQALGNQVLSASGATANGNIQTLGFCGVAPFLPVGLTSLASSIPFLQNLPGFRAGDLIDNAIGTVLDLIPAQFLPALDNGRYCYSYYYYTYCYGTSSGISRLVSLLTYPLSFFSPLFKNIINAFTTSKSTSGGVNQVNDPGLQAWNGILDDGTSVSSVTRLAGLSFPTLTSSLPTPSMADAASTNPTQLLSMSCDGRLNFLKGSPFPISFVLPPVQPLWESVFQVVQNVVTCRLRKYSATQAPLGLPQMLARFDPLAADFYLTELTTPADPWAPIPSESALPDTAAYFFPQVNKKLGVPASCNYANYALNGQCSAEYNYLNKLFPSKDLTIRMNVQSCPDYPSGLPSVSLQCVGVDCNTFLSPAAQLNPCTQDSDCGTGKTCSLIDITSLDSVTGGLFSSPPSTTPACDTALTNARTLFNTARSIMGQSAFNFPAANTFGLCQLDLQSAITSDTKTWNIGAFTTSGNTVTVTGLNLYTTPKVDNSVKSSTTGTSSLPNGYEAKFSFTLTLDTASVNAQLDALKLQLASAIDVSASRITLSGVIAVTTTTTSVTVTIAPSINSKEPTPAAALTELQRQFADSTHNSPIYQGNTTNSVSPSSLQVAEDGNSSIPIPTSGVASMQVQTLFVVALTALAHVAAWAINRRF